MENIKKQYMPLEALAIHLGLPKSFLRDLASKDLIPALRVNGRLKFNSEQVKAALNELAANWGDLYHE